MRRLAIVACVWALTGLPALALAACAGDCNGDGEVTVDELIVGVNIALGTTAVEQCTPIDANRDREVTIDEIVSAVNAALTGCPPPAPRLIVLSRDGRMASLDVAAPWTVRQTTDLGATISSARCRGGRCLVAHPSPIDTISIVDATDLSLVDTIALAKGADPRDVALVDDHTAVIGQYGSAELVELDLRTGARTAIDLSPLADADGLPETLKLAHCGQRLFAQLRRVDHETGAHAAVGAIVAVVDLERSGSERLVDADPGTPGTQGVALAGRPNFDMPVDCERGVLHVAEPALLMQGGGSYEQVDLQTLQASELAIDTGAEVGGFEYVAPGVFWIITHTTTGPAPSSHLNILGGTTPDTHNTFAREHVNDLALDRIEDLLFYPDPCVVLPANPTCASGVYPFHAHTGERASATPIEVGFLPIEVVVSR